MKPVRLLVAVVLLAGLGGVVWWSNKQQKAKAAEPPKDLSPKILALNPDSIAQLEIEKRGADPMILKKNAAGQWQMTAPQALAVDQSAASGLGSALENFSSERVVDNNATNLASYGLAPAALQVTATLKNGSKKVLLIGDDTPTGSADYAMLEGDPHLYTTSTANKTSLDKTWKDLRDKRLMTFDADKISRVELTAKKRDDEFGRINQNEWQILKPKPMRADAFQVEDLVNKLKGATMDTSCHGRRREEAVRAFASGTRSRRVKVTDPGGTRPRSPEVRDDYYAKSSVVEGVHKIATDLGKRFDKSLDDFRNKKLFDFGFSDPTRLEIKDGAKIGASESPVKTGRPTERPWTRPASQAFIDKVRDLSRRNSSTAVSPRRSSRYCGLEQEAHRESPDRRRRAKIFRATRRRFDPLPNRQSQDRRTAPSCERHMKRTAAPPDEEIVVSRRHPHRSLPAHHGRGLF